ncbi:hypothetical protein BST92_04115 [Nonlabens arenilitoris]|uniref:Uncharacterized protein n=1 Tax=Nonlabens arenilitoris TaxID=1217969 RepID=A0A2S7U874_9FLAO|nr:hypothetical protein [Nonlabens arenilitoris]PQJ31158.1 hypothetical protein BST92_04115 [Nonlabens arenilitoris]
MVLHKVFKYLALLLCVIAAGFFLYTISVGDEAIQAEAADLTNDGALQNATLAPMMYLAYAVMAITVGLVLFFVLKGIFSSPAVLKRSLISVGILVAICLIAYYGFADDAVTDPSTGKLVMLDEGEPLTEGTSKLVGASIYTFYIVAILAVGSILWTGVSKLLNR